MDSLWSIQGESTSVNPLMIFQHTKARVKMDQLHLHLRRPTFALRNPINGRAVFTLSFRGSYVFERKN
jgi:hypothetical protein